MPARYPIIPGAEAWSAPGHGSHASVAVVVSHGFTGNPTATRSLGQALAAKGFAVDVVRLPGHGTHWRDMQGTRYADWRGEVAGAVDARHAAGKRVVVVGLSLGGTIALDLAATKPEVSAICAINPTILDRQGLLPKLAPLLETVIPVVTAGMAGLVKGDIAKGGDERAYSWVPTKAANSVLRELPRIRAGLPRITAPVLVAYSPQDHSVPPENSTVLLRMLSESQAKATGLVLERSYHVATMDYDFDVLVDGIATLAERLLDA
jgi:carboxylesterase